MQGTKVRTTVLVFAAVIVMVAGGTGMVAVVSQPGGQAGLGQPTAGADCTQYSNVTLWMQCMARVPDPGTGCFVSSSYPGSTWTPVPCYTGPNPLIENGTYIGPVPIWVVTGNTSTG